MNWEMLHPRMTMEHLGYLPGFLSLRDERPAKEQLDSAYSHGGGWNPMPRWEMRGDSIKYPGDPAIKPLAKLQFRDETIFYYDHSWVCIRQANGEFEVARMD